MLALEIAGTVDIHSDEYVLQEIVSVEAGLTREQAERLATALKFSGSLHTDAVEQIMRLYGLFTDVDATQVEINPLAEASDGKGSRVQQPISLSFVSSLCSVLCGCEIEFRRLCRISAGAHLCNG